MRRTLMALALLVASPASADTPSPYAGMTDRPIRALSAEQQADLLAGRGMGLALAAELNGWPGPAHVIELAGAMQLTPAQLAATQHLMAEMQAAARALGARVIEEERALDTTFRNRSVTPADLSARTSRIAALQGEIRAVHLRTHLAQAAILNAEQIAAYSRLRGYAGGTPRHGGPMPGGHRHH
ncbi:hypothetical protein [Falsiroseomonas selenitidurans]|uniref:Periplasmic heavy metal sensor n=1 Tax=Falsiroseomonas selenitidurans TaxID=2716335 RepID=A0ABX1E5T1_9PROT|nr:hypothetical protein [Falsiroseomonas selenitidurans]NKC31133.1 hypothetical protein [Falsiroseomonas selenitidurans]